MSRSWVLRECVALGFLPFPGSVLSARNGSRLGPVRSARSGDCPGSVDSVGDSQFPGPVHSAGAGRWISWCVPGPVGVLPCCSSIAGRSACSGKCSACSGKCTARCGTSFWSPVLLGAFIRGLRSQPTVAGTVRQLVLLGVFADPSRLSRSGAGCSVAPGALCAAVWRLMSPSTSWRTSWRPAGDSCGHPTGGASGRSARRSREADRSAPGPRRCLPLLLGVCVMACSSARCCRSMRAGTRRRPAWGLPWQPCPWWTPGAWTRAWRSDCAFRSGFAVIGC